jgi:hypothetical protein
MKLTCLFDSVCSPFIPLLLPGLIFSETLHTMVLVINNYSPKARWLSVNKNRDEVEVFIHDNYKIYYKIYCQKTNLAVKDWITSVYKIKRIKYKIQLD